MHIISSVKPMSVEIISGYPCRHCGSWSVERRIDCTYHWVNFEVILAEDIANYICKSCKHILIQIVEYQEGKYD